MHKGSLQHILVSTVFHCCFEVMFRSSFFLQKNKNFDPHLIQDSHISNEWEVGCLNSVCFKEKKSNWCLRYSMGISRHFWRNVLIPIQNHARLASLHFQMCHIEVHLKFTIKKINWEIFSYFYVLLRIYEL